MAPFPSARSRYKAGPDLPALSIPKKQGSIYRKIVWKLILLVLSAGIAQCGCFGPHEITA